jgi:2-oxoglutarate dehydrogenase E1 component
MLTPKSLLRHPECVSSLNDLSAGQFNTILNDSTVNPLDVTHFVMCSGRIYYDIIAAVREKNLSDIAVVRLEQLYPFAPEMLQGIMDKFPGAQKFTWVQDEPANMGAWGFLSKWLRPMGFTLISRPFSSSPAAGSSELHKLRQKKIIDKLFGECVCERKNKECKMLCLGSTPENIQL